MSNRRSFIRNTGFTLLALFAVSFRKKTPARTVISCAPVVNTLSGTVYTIASGNWSNASIWSGGVVPSTSDTPLISAGNTVTIDTNITVQGLNVNETGLLQFNPASSVAVNTSHNIVIEGTLKMNPDTSANLHTILFTGVDESAFVGNSMNVETTDVGLWVMNNGKLLINGSAKRPWTELASGVNAGNTSIVVKDATGWQVGDEVIIATMDKPLTTADGGYYIDYDDATNTPTDSFLPRNERRTISGIAGNTISFLSPLSYNHQLITSSITSVIGTSTKTFYPEVANLSRNVRISGEDAKHRSHIFIMSNVVQTILYAEVFYMGPRQAQTYQEGVNVNTPRPQLVVGRYGIHFHHCDDGSIGSLVQGCSVHDVGARCYVPHASNGIIIDNNVAYNCQEQAIWYDFNAPTHFLTITNNLIIGARGNGVNRGSTGIELGQGDQNRCINNRVVYAAATELHANSGSYSWGADNEGVWIFIGNLAHSSLTGITVWQNTSNNHTIVDYVCFNCVEGISHGAYGNSYQYINGHMYDAKIFITATSGNPTGVSFYNYYSDINGGEYNALLQDSPIPSDPNSPNKFINCTFLNAASAAVAINCIKEDTNSEKQFKCVDVIRCAMNGTEVKLVDNEDFALKSGTLIRVQKRDGTAYQIAKDTGISNVITISAFAPVYYGTGTGLTGRYFNGQEFDTYAFTRVDSMVMFQQWSYDFGASPNKVHHLITDDNFSMEWTGSIQVQYASNYVFRLMAGGMVRLWINGVKIIDNWSTGAGSADPVDAATMAMVPGKYYTVKLQHKHPASTTGRGCRFMWKCTEMPVYAEIPVTQLYDIVLPDKGFFW